MFLSHFESFRQVFKMFSSGGLCYFLNIFVRFVKICWFVMFEHFSTFCKNWVICVSSVMVWCGANTALYYLLFDCRPDPCTGLECGSLSVVCFLCAVRFLEMNVAPAERTRKPSCPLCRSPDKRKDTNHEGFSPAFLCMSLETESRSCPLCPSYAGTPIELYRHIRQDCPGWEIPCVEHGCKNYHPRGKREEHQQTSCHAFQTCIMCPFRIQREKYRRHQKSIWHKLILLVFRRRRHYQNVSSP